MKIEKFEIYKWNSSTKYKMILIFDEFDLIATYWLNEKNENFNLNCYNITKYQIQKIYEIIEKIREME